MSVSSKEIKKRYIKCSESGVINMSDELEILQFLVNKFNLISLSEYARVNNISKPAAIKRKKVEPTIRVYNLDYFVK